MMTLFIIRWYMKIFTCICPGSRLSILKKSKGDRWPEESRAAHPKAFTGCSCSDDFAIGLVRWTAPPESLSWPLCQLVTPCKQVLKSLRFWFDEVLLFFG